MRARRPGTGVLRHEAALLFVGPDAIVNLEVTVAQLIVPNFEGDALDRLRDLARSHGRSLEEEAREILRGAVLGQRASQPHLGSRFAGRFAAIGLDDGIQELRGELATPPDFGQ